MDMNEEDKGMMTAVILIVVIGIIGILLLGLS